MSFVSGPAPQTSQTETVLQDAAHTTTLVRTRAPLEIAQDPSAVETALHVARVCPLAEDLHVSDASTRGIECCMVGIVSDFPNLADACGPAARRIPLLVELLHNIAEISAMLVESGAHIPRTSHDALVAPLFLAALAAKTIRSTTERRLAARLKRAHPVTSRSSCCAAHCAAYCATCCAAACCAAACCTAACHWHRSLRTWDRRISVGNRTISWLPVPRRLSTCWC